MFWDIISSSSIDVKALNFLSSGKGYNGLLLSPLNKTGIPLLNTWVRGNIEESPHILYPFKYGENNHLSFAMDRRTHIMDPRPHNPIFPQNNLIWIALSGTPSIQAMNPLCLELHTLFLFLLWKGQATYGNKLGTVAKMKLTIKGLKNKFVLELGTWYMLWLYFLKWW